MTRGRWALAVVVALLVLGGVAFAGATNGREQPEFSTESVRVNGVREADGDPVTLEGTLYLPAGETPRPAVLLAHGYGGSRESVAPQARDLARRGFVVLAYSSRGFGRSGGKIHLVAPRYEVRDGQAMLDLLGERPEVRKDAAGDPRVAVVGASYGGALALQLAGTDRRVDALVPSITWHDLRQALFPQFAVRGEQTTPAGVDPVAAAGVFKKQWAAVFFGSTLSSGAQEPPLRQPSPSTAPQTRQERDRFSLETLGTACGAVATDLCLGYLQAASSGRPTPELLELLAASSPMRVAGRITAPTLLIQGGADSLFPLSEGDANARAIAANGAPVSVVWTGDGHDGGTDETDHRWQLTGEFLDQVLTGPSRFTGPLAGPGLRVTVPDSTVSAVNSDPAPQHRAAGGSWATTVQPPRFRELPLSGAEQLVLNPPGATPAALTSLPGFGSALGLLGQAGAGSAAQPTGDGDDGSSSPGLNLAELPGQTARFETAPAEQPFTVTGSSRVGLRVTSTADDATLFVSLADVAPDGTATLPQQLVSPVRLEGGSGTATVALPAIVHEVQAGHRLRLVVASTDQGYALPQDARGYRVALTGGGLSVPTVPLRVDDDGPSNTPLLIGAGVMAAALVALGVLGLVRRRRTARRDRLGTDDRLAGVPLMITGLGKAYADGFRAVSDLSFEVTHGQVLGLLGPNGAGKTTTLRMLMGLITPSEGEIRIFGHRVRPGAPVLSRVGAFVEGPGFLPHLTGLANLQLYWRATGRPEADARFAVALEVAGLGDDVHRRVRTYSQGMRQRLAIAQAMLGLPELLVLDEPTNGLDPPQIREMREVLQEYAATGRTVLVSSHLLAEVEQTCSHVVVMSRGRLVAQGPVADLVGRAGTVVVDVDDPPRAGPLAEGVDGVEDVTVTDTGLLVHAPAAVRPELVRVLVEAGLEVARVAPQRGLEETFLALVGGED